MSEFRLGAAQTIPVAGDVTANVGEHLRLTELAASASPDVLLFPELSLTGYELALAPSLAFSENDDRLAPLVDAAVRLSMTLIVGAPVRLDGALHIGAFILTPRGTVDLYTKHHLGAFESARDNAGGPVPPPEERFFSPGNRNPRVRLKDRSGAVAVCADSQHRSHAQNAATAGATIYFSAQFAIPLHLGYKLSRLTESAVTHGMTIVFANFGGPTGGLAAAGSSGIWSSQAEPVVQLGGHGSGVAIAIEEPSGWRSESLTV